MQTYIKRGRGKFTAISWLTYPGGTCIDRQAVQKYNSHNRPNLELRPKSTNIPHFLLKALHNALFNGSVSILLMPNKSKGPDGTSPRGVISAHYCTSPPG